MKLRALVSSFCRSGRPCGVVKFVPCTSELAGDNWRVLKPRFSTCQVMSLVQRGVPFLFFIKVPYRPAVALFRRMVLDSLASGRFWLNHYGLRPQKLYSSENLQMIQISLLICRSLFRVSWTARRSNQSILEEISLNIHWKDWCWSWDFNTLATWCEELTH